MRPVGTSSPRPYGTIEEAIRQLINEVGGFTEAASIIGKSRSTISSYLNPDEATSITVSNLLSLESQSEKNPAIRHMARMFGYQIFKVQEQTNYHRWLAHISAITKEFGELLAAAHQCLSDDGDIDAFEAKKVLKELDEHLDVLCALRADLVDRSSGKKITALPIDENAKFVKQRDGA